MATHHNEHGFTFLTLLFTIMLLFMTLPFVGSILQSTAYASNYHEITIQQFFYFLRDDVIKASDYTVEQHALQLHLYEGDNVTIEKYGTLIRRQVNGQGHEIYLRDVKDVTFKIIPYGTHVTITSLQGETYEKSIIFYK